MQIASMITMAQPLPEPLRRPQDAPKPPALPTNCREPKEGHQAGRASGLAAILHGDQRMTESKPRPQLTADLTELHGVLIDEIERAPSEFDDKPVGTLARAVADTILDKYEISPKLQRYFAHSFLFQVLMELLVPESDNEDEDDDGLPDNARQLGQT
jgi:hypothetical protein